MKRKPNLVRTLILALVLLLISLPQSPTQAIGPGDVILNEIRTDPDYEEYFELAGVAGMALDGLTYLVVGDGDGGSGVIEAVVDLTGNTIPPSGFFVVAESTFTLGTADLVASLNFEDSDNVTHLLVEGFTGSDGDDLDTDDDGTLDVTPWTAIVDSVALIETVSSGDRVYSGTTVGPDGPFVPVHVFLCPGFPPNGWVIGDIGGEDDTPGAANSVCPAPPIPLTIMEIQGSGQVSPFWGEFVVTTGIVTLESVSGHDFWLQDLGGDGDPSTSDGIVVDDGLLWPGAPAVGDLVRVYATVNEQRFGNALELTRLNDPIFIEALSSGNPLPAPVVLDDLPDEQITDGIVFWEPLEGMRVAVYNGFVVGATSRFGEFVMLAEADAEPGSGFYPQTQQLLLRDLGAGAVDYNPERILVDDSSLNAPIVVRPGDRVRSLVGVVDYTFGNYKLQPALIDVKAHDLPNLPASVRSDGKGDLTVTTLNLGDLFDLEYNIPPVLDVIGQVGFDPGSEWGSGDTTTRDHTLHRKPSICQGDTNQMDPFDPAIEWNGFPVDTFDGLGTHATDCGSATDLLISEYVEGSGYNKALEIYNGTGFDIAIVSGGYRVEIYYNGSSLPWHTIPLTQSTSSNVQAGDVHVLAHLDADPAIIAQYDQLSSNLLFNGDDTIVLRRAPKDDVGDTPTVEELEIQLAKLALAIEVELELPEILVVQEVENTAILQALGDRVNTSAGTDYVATSYETRDVRGIEVGFLWDANRVELLDATLMSGPEVDAAFGLPLPVWDPSGKVPLGRQPLVGLFDVTGSAGGRIPMRGKPLWVIGNHFRGKQYDDPIYGRTQPPDRDTEALRKQQARVVRDYVNGILEDDPQAWVIVAGDLQDFQFPEPGEGADHPLAILEGGPGEIPLTNLVALEKEAERFTYVYDGNGQVLDHMLVSPALLDRLAGQDILHFNAGYPDVLRSDPTTPLRASDHDPVEGRFSLP